MKRLDILLHERGLAQSREQAQALILSGSVWSEGRRLEKLGLKIRSDCLLEIRSRTPPYVSRAGKKLEHALHSFSLKVRDRVCLDIGASTGGFTDCLLQQGAGCVFAVDVGFGQLDSKLRGDSRVVVMEKTNARFLSLAPLVKLRACAREISLITMDVSFISLRKIIEPLSRQLDFVRDWLLLFKPQFEVGRKQVRKGGVVKDESAIRTALSSFHEWMLTQGFIRSNGPESSPLPGKKSGNVEFLIHYERVQSSE